MVLSEPCPFVKAILILFVAVFVIDKSVMSPGLVTNEDLFEF